MPREPSAAASTARAEAKSVTEVPRMGMVSVAETAASRAGVALAMIRSYWLETKPVVITEQVAESP